MLCRAVLRCALQSLTVKVLCCTCSTVDACLVVVGCWRSRLGPVTVRCVVWCASARAFGCSSSSNSSTRAVVVFWGLAGLGLGASRLGAPGQSYGP